MAGAGHRGRWNKKNPIGTILLLLMCMFIPTLTLSAPSEEQKCPYGDYLSEKGICCIKCSAGSRLVEDCHTAGLRSNCSTCPDKQYSEVNSHTNCFRCRQCRKQKHEEEVEPCQKHKNTVCRCLAGWYKSSIDSETYECLSCGKCKENEEEKQKCTSEKNTVCECRENYYKAKGKCEPCKNCSAECRHHCFTPSPVITTASKTDEYLINIIAGVAVSAVLLLMLVILITYVATKRFTLSTQRSTLSTQPSDASPDSCEQVLVHSEEPSDDMSVTAVPQSPVSEQELSNLPDCVPLEIKIPDLIYTVLDLVPVLQMKQLVRFLGVKDTEIEQAELDHRSCREAHYQMLRVWAERGSRAGGGGRGRMLHWPLLHELLDKLRKIHLGQAAEELETKYGIQ